MTPKAQTLHARLVRNVHRCPTTHFQRGTLYESEGASFTAGLLLKDIGLSVDTVPPGKRCAPYHLHHAQDEVFFVIQGQGTLRVAGEELPIAEGDLVCIPAGPDYPHHILNTSDAPLKYLSISTRRTPEVCEYPDSGKVNAFAAGTGRLLIQRKADTLDYWDGEPGA